MSKLFETVMDLLFFAAVGYVTIEGTDSVLAGAGAVLVLCLWGAWQYMRGFRRADALWVEQSNKMLKEIQQVLKLAKNASVKPEQ